MGKKREGGGLSESCLVTEREKHNFWPIWFGKLPFCDNFFAIWPGSSAMLCRVTRARLYIKPTIWG